MDRRSFLKKTGAAAAAAVALPFGVAKLVEGVPPEIVPVGDLGDPLGNHPPPYAMNHIQLGWKAQIGKDQYGALIAVDDRVSPEIAEHMAKYMTRQMAETIVEVVGNRRALALARRMKV